MQALLGFKVTVAYVSVSLKNTGHIGLQGNPSGRLLSYNPKTRKTHVVAQGFWFANGVALAKDESFIAVVETNTQTVWKVWLTGAQVCHPAGSQQESRYLYPIACHHSALASTGCETCAEELQKKSCLAEESRTAHSCGASGSADAQKLRSSGMGRVP